MSDDIHPECVGHVRLSHYLRCREGTRGCLRSTHDPRRLETLEQAIQTAREGAEVTLDRDEVSLVSASQLTELHVRLERAEAIIATLRSRAKEYPWLYVLLPQEAAPSVSSDPEPDEVTVLESPDPAYQKGSIIRGPSFGDPKRIVTGIVYGQHSDGLDEWWVDTVDPEEKPSNMVLLTQPIEVLRFAGEMARYYVKETSREAPSVTRRWRTGHRLGRTLYRDDVHVGMVDTPELARELVNAANAKPSGVTPGVTANDPPTPPRSPEEGGSDATQVAGATPAGSSGSRERGESSGGVGLRTSEAIPVCAVCRKPGDPFRCLEHPDAVVALPSILDEDAEWRRTNEARRDLREALQALETGSKAR